MPKVFPYAYTIDDLPNGLRLVTVPTDYPNLVALYIVVNTGSRNEVEAGKSGYAHLFEHLMFRGSENYTPEQRDAILKRAGASSNAYTSDDRTVYHEVFAKEDLNEILKMEADRFLRLKYGADVYRTETQAVLGEYNKNSADPFSKLYEKLRETAFDKHTYKHTTMGFIKDIQDMPNQYNYSLDFYRRYYRPENTTVVLSGDVTQEQALKLIKQYFGDWQRGNYSPQIPVEPELKGPRTGRVEWPSETLPHMAIAFRGPAFSDQKKDKAALDLLAAVAFGENSDIYQQLVLKEQKVDVIEVSFEDQSDPELFTVFVRIKEPKDVDYVRDQILATFKQYAKELVRATRCCSAGRFRPACARGGRPRVRHARPRAAPGRADPRAGDRVPALDPPHRRRVAQPPGAARLVVEEGHRDARREDDDHGEGEREGERADPGGVTLGRQAPWAARVAEELAGGVQAAGGDHDVTRAGGEEVGHVEPARAACERRDALLQQEALDELGLGLIARPGGADERAFGVGLVDLAGALGELGARRLLGRAFADQGKPALRAEALVRLVRRRARGAHERVGQSVTSSSTCS